MAIDLRSASPLMASIAACVTAARSTASISILNFPETMRELSSRSSMSCDWVLTHRSIASLPRLTRSSSSSPRRIICACMSMVPSAVRSSCESVARNSSFARLARSASSLAARASTRRATRSASACLRWVMSSIASRTMGTPMRDLTVRADRESHLFLVAKSSSTSWPWKPDAAVNNRPLSADRSCGLSQLHLRGATLLVSRTHEPSPCRPEIKDGGERGPSAQHGHGG